MASIEDKPSTARRYWNATSAYAKRVFGAYVDFLVPLGMLVVVGSALDVTSFDRERVGLGWLFYSQMESDQEREERLPAYPPGSPAQVKRTKAAKLTTSVDAL